MPHIRSDTARSQKRFVHSAIKPLYKPHKAPRLEAASDKKPVMLVGENPQLEKAYVRLTGEPRREDVRPLKVLIKSLAHIKATYAQNEDFEWANEQLKSVRQDLVVQGLLQNRFARDVYETHARILLENGDLDEFQQCQSMIRSLTKGNGALDDVSVQASLGSVARSFELGVNRTMSKPRRQTPEDEDEFLGYSILYSLVRNSSIDLKIELQRAKSAGCSEERESSCSHAVKVVKAVEGDDYRSFFRLYENAPHMSAYLCDFLVKRVRDGALDRVLSAHRPNVSVEYIRECLHFEDLDETRRFLRQKRAVFVDELTEPEFWVDCKASLSRM